MMFFHIPLYVYYICRQLRVLLTFMTSFRPESYAQPDKDTRTGAPLDVGLRGLEPKGAAKKNEGFFEKALLAAMESEHLAKGSVREVKVVGNGHCHRTYCFSLLKLNIDTFCWQSRRIVDASKGSGCASAVEGQPHIII